jgi:hypothetical protein
VKEEADMGEIAVVDNVSITQLRVLGVVGLLATAVISTLLSLIHGAGGVALARWVRHALDHRRGVAHGSMRRSTPPRNEVLGAERGVPDSISASRSARRLQTESE